MPEAAVVAVAKFFARMVKFVAGKIGAPSLLQFADMIPLTMRKLRVMSGIHKLVAFKKLSVCPSCSMSIMPTADAMIWLPDGSCKSRRCTFVEFPVNPILRMRQRCDAVLLKTLKTKNYEKLVPSYRKTFCYIPLKDQIEKLVKRPNFLPLCEKWRERDNIAERFGIMEDIYDGAVWHDFMCLDCSGEPVAFLSNPNNLLLSLNVDWFQPYERTQYSVGAMYLVVNNLPRSQRFKLNNVILVGVIPGPNEPKLTMNSYLEFLVDELLDMFHGFWVEADCFAGGLKFVRVALGCISCDIPATRKILGFASHSAAMGCSKCMKRFKSSRFGSRLNYSGFEIDDWQPRDGLAGHRVHSRKYNAAKTKTEQQKCLQESGVRYSVITELPYFDVVRHSVIDPMHNLFLGTPKVMIAIWRSIGVFSDDSLKAMQSIIDGVVIPTDMGRIPRKIASGFDSFTADEWRNWVTVFSPLVLRQRLTDEQWEHWKKYIFACKLLCSRSVLPVAIALGEKLLLEFCREFECLYGAEKVTPNMHLHCHVVDSIRDYGPVYAFWLFSFERYNGILGGFHTNNHDIESQFVYRFLEKQCNIDALWEEEFKEIWTNLINMDNCTRGSLGERTDSSNNLVQQIEMCCSSPTIVDFGSFEIYASIVGASFHDLLNSSDAKLLKGMYQHIYGNDRVLHTPQSFRRASRVLLRGEMLSSVQARGSRSAYVFASWFSGMHDCIIVTNDCSEVRLGRIQYFLHHRVTILSQDKQAVHQCDHLLALVDWFQNHDHRDLVQPLSTVWSTQVEPDASASFIPVGRIMSRASIAKVHSILKPPLSEETVVVGMWLSNSGLYSKIHTLFHGTS